MYIYIHIYIYIYIAFKTYIRRHGYFNCPMGVGPEKWSLLNSAATDHPGDNREQQRTTGRRRSKVCYHHPFYDVNNRATGSQQSRQLDAKDHTQINQLYLFMLSCVPPVLQHLLSKKRHNVIFCLRDQDTHANRNRVPLTWSTKC